MYLPGCFEKLFSYTRLSCFCLFFFFHQHSKITAGRRHCVSALNVLCSKHPNVKSDKKKKKSSSFGRWRTFRVSSVFPQKLFLSSRGPLIPCPGKQAHIILQLGTRHAILWEAAGRKRKETLVVILQKIRRSLQVKCFLWSSLTSHWFPAPWDLVSFTLWC